MKEIYLITRVGLLGGCATESLHLIHLLVYHGVKVNLISSGYFETQIKEHLLSLGVNLIQFPANLQGWKFIADKVVVILGYIPGLLHLPLLQHAQPKKLVYVTPMWHPSGTELQFIKQGYLQTIVYVSEAQKQHHQDLYKLQQIKAPEELTGYMPYFDLGDIIQNLRFRLKRDKTYLGLGRISRDDPNKHSPDTWRIFDEINSYLPKRVICQGTGENSLQKIGRPPTGLAVQFRNALEHPVADFYNETHIIIQKTDSSGESFGRWVLEAWATGTPIITEKAFSFPEITTSATAILCKTTEEFIEAGSKLAEDADLYDSMAIEGRKRLQENWGNSDKCWVFWDKLLN